MEADQSGINFNKCSRADQSIFIFGLDFKRVVISSCSGFVHVKSGSDKFHDRSAPCAIGSYWQVGSDNNEFYMCW